MPDQNAVADITPEQLDQTSNYRELRQYTKLILQCVQSTNARLEIIENRLATTSERNVQLMKDNAALLESNAQLRSDNTDLRAVVTDLQQRVHTNERTIIANGQYLRRRQLTIVAKDGDIIEHSASLKTTVASLLSTTGAEVRALDIDKCHILNKAKGVVIMELHSRTLRDDILLSRKHLKGVTHEKYGNIYINESLTKGMKSLDFICRKLKKNRSINSTWIWNGRLFIKKDPDATKLPIGHISDLLEEFGADLIDPLLEH